MIRVMHRIVLALIIAGVLGVGYFVPKFFINEPFGVRDMPYGYQLQPNGQTKKIYFCGGSEQDPDVLVAAHLNNHIQKFLTIKLVFTNEDLNRNVNVYKAYTLFGIPISTVEVDCKTGNIQTVSGL